jgi:hypothetical protein
MSKPHCKAFECSCIKIKVQAALTIKKQKSSSTNHGNEPLQAYGDSNTNFTLN